MQVNINIHETVAGDLFVKELAYEQGFYDTVIPFNKSVSITVLKRITSQKSEIVKAFIHKHHVTEVINKFKVKYDGWYEVTHIIVPTIDWAEQQETAPEKLYVSDGVKLYLYENGIITEIYIDEALEDTELESAVTARAQKSMFVLFNLWQCYLNYCKRMLEGECSKDNKCSDCNDEGTKNRHLIWIFLNAIQYHVHFGELEAAQELLENISGCNTLCGNEMFSKLYDCGCGK